jgi:hypothetical protein
VRRFGAAWKSVPEEIKVASFVLTILMILMFMVPLILLIIENLQAAGF